MILVESLRIFTRPLTSTALCLSFCRSPETPAVPPQYPGYDAFDVQVTTPLSLVGEDVEGPGCRGASLVNCKARVLLDQQGPHRARAEYFKGDSSDLWFLFLCFLEVF